MGYFLVRKFKPKSGDKKHVDIRATKEAGKTVYFLNRHTNGYCFSLFWSRPPFNTYPYIFRPTTVHKRFLGQHILDTCADPLQKDYDAVVIQRAERKKKK